MNGEVNAIEAAGLTKRFGEKTVVDQVSLEVKQGEIVGFLGPNGSGKTTTIRMLTGLLTPDSGTGSCLGFDIVREADQIKRNIGYMTQRFSFYEDLSIRENLEFVARLYNLTPMRDYVDRTLERLGLTTWVIRGVANGALAEDLRRQPGVEQVAQFGTTLHVVGADAVALRAAIDRYADRPGIAIAPGETSLEDVFIRLMSQHGEVRS
ncbi:ABC transporter ATP-binding protein [Emcibacter sp. SYSU 3D8]|uniref:ABC transporter ATP-binding protein n=1 Tax=Emcibacter sp. SYSU 3D8 TaxID=3133969 RepID=UPI0031FE59D6